MARRRSFLLPLAVLALTSAGVVYLLRRGPGGTPDLPAPPPPVAAVAGSAGPGHKVIFLGLDGADWDLLLPYAESGAMPQLAALVREGRPGVLTTIEPPLSPLVWTTMMTGASPVEHGVLDFTRFHPASGAREPISREERRVPALWNMATAAGKSVAVFGLWATWPAEPVGGLVVSDRLISTPPGREPPAGAVYPQEATAWVRQTQARAEGEIGLEALRAYLPGLSAEEHRQAVEAPEPLAHPVSGLRRILAETRAVDALASAWIGRHAPDLAIVYFQGTDLVGHLFAPYAPPRQASVSEADFQRYRGVPALYFREIDRLLGEYRRLAEQTGAVLMLASDHGFAWGEGRPHAVASQEAATAGKWHQREGISLLWGPGVVPGPGEEESVDRVAATLLALLGLPRGEGLAEGPLSGVAASPRSLDYGPIYRQPAPGSLTSATVGREALARLEALGYLGGGEVAQAPAARLLGEATRTPGSFNNEGLILRSWGEAARAREAFEKALRLDPGYPSALWNLSELLFREPGSAEKADPLLLQAVAAGLPQGAEAVVGRARAWKEGGQVERALALLTSALNAQPNDPLLRLWRGKMRLEQGDCPAALADFAQAAALSPTDPTAHTSLGLARACVGDLPGAREALVRSLELDPNQPVVRAALVELAAQSLPRQ